MTMKNAPGKDETISYLVKGIDATLWRKAKAQAALNNQTMKAVFEDALRDLIKGGK